MATIDACSVVGSSVHANYARGRALPAAARLCLISATSRWMVGGDPGGDHSDGIQAFAPGATGTIFLNNTFIRAYRDWRRAAGMARSAPSLPTTGPALQVPQRRVSEWGVWLPRISRHRRRHAHRLLTRSISSGRLLILPFDIGASLSAAIVTVIDRGLTYSQCDHCRRCDCSGQRHTVAVEGLRWPLPIAPITFWRWRALIRR